MGSIVNEMIQPNLIIILIFLSMLLMATAKRTLPFIFFSSLLLLYWLMFVYDYAFSMQQTPHKILENLAGILYPLFPWMVWGFFVYGIYANIINLCKRSKA